MKKLVLVSVLTFAIIFAGSGVAFAKPPSGLTTSQIQAIISLLRSFGAEESVISNVQVSLTGGAPTPVSSANQFCYTWTRNLQIGDMSADVDALVIALVDSGVLANLGREKILFSEQIASAVVEFQEKYASEILTPNGLRRGNGYVGPSTRAKLNALYECGNSTQFSLSSKSVETKNGTDVLYTVNLSSPAQRSSGGWTLSLSCPAGVTATTQIKGGLGCGDIAKISSGSTVEVLFNNSTNVPQTIGVTAQLLSGKDDITPIATDRDAITILPDANIGANQPSITVTYPKGGENMVTGDPMLIRWTPTVPVSIIEIVSVIGNYSFGIYGPKYGHVTPITTGQYEYTIVSSTPAGTYYARITPADGSAQAISKTFTINQINQPSITVLSPNGGETLNLGGTYPIRWSSSNINSAYLHIGLIGPQGTNLSQVEPHATNNGTFNWTVGTGLQTGQYKITITDPNNFSITDQSDSYFNITAAQTIPIKSISIDASNNVHFSLSQQASACLQLKDSQGNYFALNSSQLSYSCANTTLFTGYQTELTIPQSSFARTIIAGQYYQVCNADTRGNRYAVCSNPIPILVTASTQPSITVTAPTAGQTIEGKAGTSFNVQWATTNWPSGTLANIDLIRVSDGVTVRARTGVPSQNGAVNTASININNDATVSKQYRARVSRADMSVHNQSYEADSGVFMIVPPTAQPSITITSPNVGETLTVGQDYTIRWVSPVTDLSHYQITLENKASNNIGALIGNNISKNATSYSFNLTNGNVQAVVANSSGVSADQIKNDYYFKIRAMIPVYLASDASFAGYSFDVSGRSNYFTITAPTVASAVSYESVAQLYRELLRREPETGGAEYWLGTGFTIDGIRNGIIASYEYGIKKQIKDAYRELLGRNLTDAELTYWYNKMYVEKNTLSQVREGIMASSEYQNRATVSALTAQPSITVTSPRGGEIVSYGQRVPVSWNYSGFGSGVYHVSAYAVPQDGRPEFVVAVNYVISDNNNINFLVEREYRSGTGQVVQSNLFLPGSYKIRVACQISNPEGYRSCSDVSDGAFTIVASAVSALTTQPSITVTAPVQNQTIEGKAGTSFTVAWATQNWSPDTLVNIDTIYYPGGSVVRARSAIPNSGAATININTNATESKTLRMRVSAAKSGTLAAGETADSGYFTITPPTPTPTPTPLPTSSPTAFAPEAGQNTTVSRASLLRSLSSALSAIQDILRQLQEGQ